MKNWVKLLAATGAVALLGAGCFQTTMETDTDVNGEADTGSMGDNDTTGEAEVSAKTSVTLHEQNDSGESGGVVLTDEGGKTRVVITIAGQADGADQPAHIHTGACATIGAVLFPLNNVVDGRSETVIDTSLADLLATATALSINVHKSALDLGTYVACGDIKAE